MENILKESDDDVVEQYCGVIGVPLPAKKVDRIKGEKYIFKDKVVIWGGKGLFCEHGRREVMCGPCGGSQICEHGHIWWCKVVSPVRGYRP